MYIRFLFNSGECIYLVSFWGYKKYIPYFIWFRAQAISMVRVQGWVSGFRVQGSGFRVQGLGFRVYGLGFRV